MSMRIGPGMQVQLHFAIKLASGAVVDSTFDKAPATFIVGDGNLLPGFEQVLFGLAAGDAGEFSIEPAQGFGAVNPNNIQTMPRSAFTDMTLSEGLLVVFKDAAQTELPGVVTAYTDTQVTVNFNHPLAGKTLSFVIEIIAVSPAQRIDTHA